MSDFPFKLGFDDTTIDKIITKNYSPFYKGLRNIETKPRGVLADIVFRGNEWVQETGSKCTSINTRLGRAQEGLVRSLISLNSRFNIHEKTDRASRHDVFADDYFSHKEIQFHVQASRNGKNSINKGSIETDIRKQPEVLGVVVIMQSGKDSIYELHPKYKNQVQVNLGGFFALVSSTNKNLLKHPVNYDKTLHSRFMKRFTKYVKSNTILLEYVFSSDKEFKNQWNAP